ncbi:MAG: hypothetical protein WCJ30_13155 [Deltaproteobacteria bacterium]
MCVTRDALLSAVVLGVGRDGRLVRDADLEPLRALGISPGVARRAFEALPESDARTHALARVDAVFSPGR